MLRAGLSGIGDGRRGAGVLVNDVLAADPASVLLVLDDVHVITDPEALAALDYLLDHAPPALRVLATARTDPPLGLARRRVRGRLAEIGADRLRCRPDRAEALLNGCLDLRLSPEQVEHTVAVSGGWITGVRLLGESIARGAAGEHGGGPAGSPALYDYLVEEVLDEVPEHLRRFLLDVCVLDELTPAACGAVSMRADAAALLASLHRTHEFLVLRDGQVPGGYRYQSLFAAFLRGRLDLEPARAVKLHRRAADAVTDPARRIEHLLAAGAHDEAADEIERLSRTALHHSAATRGLARWVELLDPPYRERPWPTVVAGLAARGRGDMRRAARLLESALERFAAAGDVPGQWLAARNLHMATMDHSRFVPILALLESSPDFGLLPVAAQVDHHTSAGYGALHTGRWDEAARRLAIAIDLTTSSGDPDAVEVLAQELGPPLAACDGGVDLIESYSRWVQHHVVDPPPLVRLGTDQQTATAAFLRGRLDEAVAAVDRAGDLPERLGGLPYVRACLDGVRAGAAFARGDLTRTLQILDECRTDSETPASDVQRSMRVEALALRARVLRLQRRVSELAALVQELNAITPGLRHADRLQLVAVSMRAQAAWATGDLDGAARILRGGQPLEARLRLVGRVGILGLDLALVLAESGQPGAARRELDGVLALVARRGWVGVLVQAGPEVVPLLAAAVGPGAGGRVAAAALDVLRDAPRASAVPVPGTAEVLSAREVEVLRLLAGGMSNTDLAGQLVVSVNTVKTHVGRIMSKLGARSRTEAVARARTLHLL